MRSVLLRLPNPIEHKIDAREHALTLTRRRERTKRFVQPVLPQCLGGVEGINSHTKALAPT